MPGENILLILRQINICLGLYGNEALAANGMTFAQVFLLDVNFSMDAPCICSTDLSEKVGFTRSSISRTLKELKKNGYVKMKIDERDNRRKHIILTQKAISAKEEIENYIDNLNRCLVQEIPEERLNGTGDVLRSILDNIQRETLRRPV